MVEMETSEATKEELEKKGAVVEAAPVIEERQLTVGAKKKICIVGFAPGRENAPYDDPSFEFWGVNEMYMAKEVKKIDVLFELHDYKWIKEGKRYKEHLQWLRDAPETRISVHMHPDVFDLFVVGADAGWSTFHNGGTYSITRELKLNR